MDGPLPKKEVDFEGQVQEIHLHVHDVPVHMVQVQAVHVHNVRVHDVQVKKEVSLCSF